jgi:ABC-type branched-subunit amino acid transport system ATPase component
MIEEKVLVQKFLNRKQRERLRKPDWLKIKLGDPRSVRQAAVIRNYQTPQTYLELTCIENVLLSSPDRRFTGIFASTSLRSPLRSFSAVVFVAWTDRGFHSGRRSQPFVRRP